MKKETTLLKKPRRQNKPSKAAVNDPIRDAEQRMLQTARHSEPDAAQDGAVYRRVSKRGLSDDAVFRHTTGEFNRSGHKYQSHCTPTAITNLILTLARGSVYPRLESETPQSVFESVVKIGKRYLLYFDMYLFHRFGGTAVPFNGIYLRLALKHFGIKVRRIRPRLILRKERLIHAMSEGHPALISVLGHPVYGSHTMMAYGMDFLQDAQGHPAAYLRLADGWATRPRYINLKDLNLAAFWEIEP